MLSTIGPPRGAGGTGCTFPPLVSAGAGGARRTAINSRSGDMIRQEGRGRADRGWRFLYRKRHPRSARPLPSCRIMSPLLLLIAVRRAPPAPADTSGGNVQPVPPAPRGGPMVDSIVVEKKAHRLSLYYAGRRV